LVEVVEEGFQGGLLLFPAGEIRGELGLGWHPGGTDQGGEVGSPMWLRIRMMGSGSVRNAMNVGVPDRFKCGFGPVIGPVNPGIFRHDLGATTADRASCP
jgi:hypothetical protein